MVEWFGGENGRTNGGGEKKGNEGGEEKNEWLKEIERKQDVAEGAELGHCRRGYMVELINNQG